VVVISFHGFLQSLDDVTASDVELVGHDSMDTTKKYFLLGMFFGPSGVLSRQDLHKNGADVGPLVLGSLGEKLGNSPTNFVHCLSDQLREGFRAGRKGILFALHWNCKLGLGLLEFLLVLGNHCILTGDD